MAAHHSHLHGSNNSEQCCQGKYQCLPRAVQAWDDILLSSGNTHREERRKDTPDVLRLETLADVNLHVTFVRIVRVIGRMILNVLTRQCIIFCELQNIYTM